MIWLAATPRALGDGVHVFGGRGVEVDGSCGDVRPDGDLVHVDIGGVQKRSPRPHRDHREGIGHGLGAEGGAFERVEGDIDLLALSGAHALADIEHRGLVALALADDHPAPDVEAVELGPHGIDRGLVGIGLGAASDQIGGGDGGGLAGMGQAQGQHPAVIGGVLADAGHGVAPGQVRGSGAGGRGGQIRVGIYTRRGACGAGGRSDDGRAGRMRRVWGNQEVQGPERKKDGGGRSRPHRC